MAAAGVDRPVSVVAGVDKPVLMVVLTALCAGLAVHAVPSQYLLQRQALQDAEQAMRIGGIGTDLSVDEQKVNAILLKEKRAFIEAARQNRSDFVVRHNFLTARAAMETTKAFNIIKRMPKGAVLHLHDTAMTSIEWVIQNVTYRPNCYMCVNSAYKVRFGFYNNPPPSSGCSWRLVADFRSESGDIAAFDKTLHNNLSLVTPDPAKAYPDTDSVWTVFQGYFSTLGGLSSHAHVYGDYLLEGLRQFKADNVQYVEIRASMHRLYELDGSAHNGEFTFDLIRRVVDQFLQENPDFSGIKVIIQGNRFDSTSSQLAKLKEAIVLRIKDPELAAGYDIVGQEDPWHPEYFYLDDLLYPSQQDPPVDLPYFIHAGETNWQETESDYNLLDALMLNTTRIGHGYALYKHPLLMDEIRKRNIAIEVNPISNQVLKLVADPRNHPAASLIASGFPLVISSDDPAAWEALPLSHDFYVTFMALTGEQTGLATLKQLALNSLSYSVMSDQHKQRAIASWRQKWRQFIHDVIHDDAFQQDILIG